MNRRKIDVFDYVEDVNRLMRDGGLLLVTKTDESEPNAMTIGWGFLGTMWRQPVFVVAVRFSRHTYELIEKSDSFTVCLPSHHMKNVLEVCGTKSGRDINKFKELGLTEGESVLIKTPYINEAPVHFECKIIFKNAVELGQLPKDLESEVYPNKNMHMLYYGQVMGVYAVKEAHDLFPK